MALEAAWSAGSQDTDLLFMIASAHLFANEIEVAREAGTALSQRSPNHPGGHLLRGYVMGKQGNDDQARTALHSALSPCLP